MQPPTCRGIRIRSTYDAHRIIRAVELGVLPITQRRLDGEERKALRSGDVWVWEERGTGSDNTGLGIERWTDGRTYGPSRVRDDFLFYSERDMEPFQPQGPYIHRDRESLVKQTYSVFIRERNGRQKKWHITAYFSQSSVEDLATVDHIPAVACLPVPEGRYTSARSSKHKSREDGRRTRSRDGSDDFMPQSPVDRGWPVYAPYGAVSAAPQGGSVPQYAQPRSATPGMRPSMPQRSTSSGSTGLVPLSYLQNPPLSPSHRHPEDEKVLRSLTFGA